MGFQLGGFSAGGGCGCCAPPCTWSLWVPADAECAPPPGWGTTFDDPRYRLSISVRFQGPNGEDVTKTNWYVDGATATVSLIGSSLFVTIPHHGLGYATTPAVTWSGGTRLDGGDPVYPTTTLVMESFGLGLSVWGVTLSGPNASGWATPPTLTIAPPDRPVWHPGVYYQDPAAGEWTITVSHPCYPTQLVSTVTIEQCRSVSLPKQVLPYPWTTADYSDSFGTATIALTDMVGAKPYCAGNSGYIYTSLKRWKSVVCGTYHHPYPYTTCGECRLVGYGTKDEDTNVSVSVASSDAGWVVSALWSAGFITVNVDCDTFYVMHAGFVYSTVLRKMYVRATDREVQAMLGYGPPEDRPQCDPLSAETMPCQVFSCTEGDPDIPPIGTGDHHGYTVMRGTVVVPCGSPLDLDITFNPHVDDPAAIEQPETCHVTIS